MERRPGGGVRLVEVVMVVCFTGGGLAVFLSKNRYCVVDRLLWRYDCGCDGRRIISGPPECARLQRKDSRDYISVGSPVFLLLTYFGTSWKDAACCPKMLHHL